MEKLFEIKHRFSGSVLFKLECSSLKICIEAAVNQGAYLEGAYLEGADLRGADLRGASLRGADGKKITIKETPLQILGLRWNIIIFDSHMKIGCEFHSIKKWSEFNIDQIDNMYIGALEFWEKSKGFIMNICKENGRV